MLYSIVLAALLGGGCHVQQAQAVAVQQAYVPAIAAVPVYLTWRVGEDEHQQQLIEKLIAIEEQNSETIAALAGGGEPETLTAANQVRELIDSRCVKCHSAGNAKGGVDLSGAIPTELRLRCVKEIVGGRMPKGGAKFSPEETELTFDWAHEE